VSALDLTEIAETILDVATAALDEIPTFDATLLGAPDRVLPTPGLPVDDCCDQLAVHVDPLATLFGRDTRNVAWIYSVTFTLTIGRCLPAPVKLPGGKYRPPTVDELAAAARQINADGWALWNGLHNAILRDGALPPECGKAAIQNAVARDPSGGCGGWTIPVVLTVDGYETAPVGS
jgi:hypothetical protein